MKLLNFIDKHGDMISGALCAIIGIGTGAAIITVVIFEILK